MSLEHPHPEPRSYPLMLRTWDYAWWRPAIGLVLLPLAMFVVVPLFVLPLTAVAVAVDHTGNFGDAFGDTLALERPITWQALLFLNLSLAGLIPATWVIMRTLHRMRPRWLTSVAPGLRWKFFSACLGLSLVAIAAQLVVGSFLPGDANDLGSGLNTITGQLLASLAVIALTTPFQAIGEEYAFRGYLLQAVGALTRRPWVAILVTGLLFGLAHGVQNAPLFVDRFTFGVMAAYLVYRTGGLEAGIALHIWNNVVAFGFALLIGDVYDTLSVDSVPWNNLLLTITQNGVYLLLVLYVARRMGVTNRTTPPVLPPASPPV